MLRITGYSPNRNALLDQNGIAGLQVVSGMLDDMPQQFVNLTIQIGAHTRLSSYSQHLHICP